MPGPALSVLGSPSSACRGLRHCSTPSGHHTTYPPQQSPVVPSPESVGGREPVSHAAQPTSTIATPLSPATQHLVSVKFAFAPAHSHIRCFNCCAMAVLSRAAVTTVAASLPKEAPLSSNAAQVRLPSFPFLRPATAFVGSLLASAPAALAAVNYDDFVKRASESASSSFPDVALPSVELPAVDFDGATDFVTANPLALVVGLVAVAVPFIASRAFASPAAFGSVSAVDAFERLSNPEQNAQLLDIRAPEDIKAEGSPNLKSTKKRIVKVAYAAEDDAFVDKVFAKFKDAENTTLYILDRFDGNAASVAKLLANSGFKGAFAIKGGAVGPNGWQEKDLPWAMPTKSFSINIDSLKNIIGDNQGDAGNLVPTTVGLAAAAGVGLVVFSEAETTLQLLGTVAVAQLFLKKFLFAEDRKTTIAQIKTFLDTKIAPQEFVDEIKEVGRVLLPKEGEVKAAVATGATILEKELGVDSVTPEAIGEKTKEKFVEEAEKVGVEIPDVEAITSDLKSSAEELQSNVKEAASDLESTNGFSNGSGPPAVEDDTPSKALPVLLEPPSLPPKAEAGAEVEEESPVAEPVAEPSITTAAAVTEVTPFFESDSVKPVNPFQPVAEAVTADSSSDHMEASVWGGLHMITEASSRIIGKILLTMSGSSLNS